MSTRSRGNRLASSSSGSIRLELRSRPSAFRREMVRIFAQLDLRIARAFALEADAVAVFDPTELLQDLLAVGHPTGDAV